MEALIIVLVLVGLASFALGVSFYVLLVRTLRMHRQAMHALHQHLAQQAVPRTPFPQQRPAPQQESDR